MLVKARVAKRDDRISLIANDLVVPDLSEIGSAGVAAQDARHQVPVGDRHAAQGRAAQRTPARPRCTCNLISTRRRNTLLKLDDALRVAPTPSLMGDLKALLGPGCLG